MQSWCRTWPPNGSRHIRAKQKFLRKPREACKSSWNPIGILESFTLIIPWNSAKLLKILPGITVRQHLRSETHGIAGRAVRRIKEGSSTVLLQASLDEKWWADSMEFYCYLQNIQYLLYDGKTPCERRFGERFRGPMIPFGSMIESLSISAKDLSRPHQFGKKVLPGIIPGYVLYAERNLERRHFGRRH